MSTAPTARPTHQHPATSTYRPTATFPVRRPILPRPDRAAPGRPAAYPATASAGWRDATPTEELPTVTAPASPRRERSALARHLRAALAGVLIAAAILIPMQLFAAQGISSARQAALAARTGQAPMSGQPAPMSDRASAARPGVRTDIQAGWVTEDTGAAYDRTNPAASPLNLPRCTTSPDTPLPCLATISPDSKRAVVLEEDASLTALVRR